MFWRETPRSFVNAIEGAALRRKRELDAALFTAWHTAIFALNGYSGGLKGKTLADFLGTETKPQSEDLQNARAIAFFHSLKARGLPIDITRH